MNKKITTILASILIGLTSVGTGLSAWVYNSSTNNNTDINTNINNFKFSTLTIRESDDSASGNLSKIGTTVHNYRCDNKDLGYTNAVIDVCEYFTITSDDDSNLSKAKYKIVSGSGSISGDELTFGDIAGNVVVRCYEEGCEDNFYDLTFTNTITTNTADHDYKTTYGTISWGDWSASATFLSNNQHTRSRTGLLPYSTKCSICDYEKASGNLTIDSSNYSTYSVYNTDSNTYIKTESCTEDSGTYVSDSRTESYGTKNYTGYEQYSSTSSYYSKYHKHKYTRSYSYTSGYGSGYKYYCSDCSHLMRDTRTYYSADSGIQKSYDMEKHSFTSSVSTSYGDWEYDSSTQHRRKVTVTTTKTCACGYSTSSDSSSYEYESHSCSLLSTNTDTSSTTWGSKSYTGYTSAGSSGHYHNWTQKGTYTVTTTKIYGCSKCDYSYSTESDSKKETSRSGNDGLESHSFVNNATTQEIKKCGGSFTRSKLGIMDSDGNTTYIYTCKKCGYNFNSSATSYSGKCTQSTSSVSWSCKYCGYTKTSL